MSAKTLSVKALVLMKAQSAGGYERLSLLTRDEGLLHAMRRPAAKGTVPDLFDLAELLLSARQGGAWFMNEYVPERRHTGIGASYSALAAASAWARLVLANAPSMDGTEGLYDLSLKTFDALDRGLHAELVLAKALFSFAVSEGLPAREEWLPRLSQDKRNAVSALLFKPVSGADEALVAAHADAGLCESLTRWMCTEHHIIQPRTE